MHTRLKPAEIRWLTPTVGTLPSGLQTTLLLTAGLALWVGRQREVQLKSVSPVSTLKDVPLQRHYDPQREQAPSWPSHLWTESQLCSSGAHCLLPSLFTAGEQKSF